MRSVEAPRTHLFVCTNRRPPTDPLGAGCGDRGDAVYAAMKDAIARRGAFSAVWVTRTYCLGVCPRRGATVACFPDSSPIRSEVEARDAAPIVDEAIAARGAPTVADVSRELRAMEELQQRKVLELARRLRPGLTAEDVQNPHDFPELDDVDWQHADGVLTGVQSASSMVQALVASRERPR